MCNNHLPQHLCTWLCRPMAPSKLVLIGRWKVLLTANCSNGGILQLVAWERVCMWIRMYVCIAGVQHDSQVRTG